MRLLSHPPLRPGESLPSLLFRLTAENRYHSPAVIARLCGDDNLAQPTRAETYRVLSELANIEAGTLYDATAHRFGPTITPPGSNLSSITLPSGREAVILGHNVLREHTRPASDVQFCPLCLREAPYHRLGWFPLAVTVCLEHQCLLVYHCSKCRKGLKVLDITEGRCPHCDFELADAPVISVAADSFGLFSQAVIQSWLGLAPMPPVEGLPAQPAAALYRLLDGLRRAAMNARTWDYLHRTPADTGCSSFHCVSKSDFIPPRSFVLYATAFKGLLHWPQGFYDFLDAYKRRDGRQPAGQIAQDLGILYNVWLERYWQPLDFVQAAFDQYLLDNYTLTPSLIRLRRTSPTFLAQLPYLTEADAARLLGTNGAMIKRLVRSGFLVSQVEADALPQRFNLVRRIEVEELQQKWQGAIPSQEAAQVLGASEDVALGLVKAGLLEAVRGPGADGSYAWKLSYRSITNFINRLQQGAGRQPDQPVDLVSAAQMLSTYGFNLAAVVERVLAGELRSYWPGRELNGLVIARRDLETLIESIRASRPLLTRQQVAGLLKVKIPTVSAWVKTGLLAPVEQRGQAMYFDREAFQSFLDDHIFVEEAADILGVGKLVVQEWARNGRLRPVSGPGVDDLHRYLFRREDVERLRPENRLTGPQLAKLLGLSRSQLWQWIRQGKVRPVSGPGIDGSRHYLFERPRVV